jgi:hypothetical protein
MATLDPAAKKKHHAHRPDTWYAWPSSHVGYELVGAGMLILAGHGRGLPFDYDELERWTRVGYERGMRQRAGER